MYYGVGRRHALHQLGFIKQARTVTTPPPNVIKTILRRLARGRSHIPLSSVQNPTTTEVLVGRPQELLKPRHLLSQVASLRPTREAILALQGLGPKGADTLARLQGLGGLSIDLLHKGLVFGVPTYLIHKALKKPTPGKTRGEEIGRAVGQSLGWLPPMGLLGTAATVVAPNYSMPGLIGTLGEHAGGAISQIVGEQPTEIAPPPIRVQSAT